MSIKNKTDDNELSKCDKKKRDEKVKLVRDNSRCDRVQRVNLPSHSWRSTNPIVQGIAAR